MRATAKGAGAACMSSSMLRLSLHELLDESNPHPHPNRPLAFTHRLSLDELLDGDHGLGRTDINNLHSRAPAR